jgi:hypothetical protein
MTPQHQIIHREAVATSSAAECARELPRHAAHSVRCRLGEVADLSRGGARIITANVPRSPVDVEFYAMNKSVTVRARVAWTRPTGSGFRTEVGLVFIKLSRTQREVIDSLASGQLHRALL